MLFTNSEGQLYLKLLFPLEPFPDCSFLGFSKSFVKAFKNGFPPNWMKLVDEHFESQIR